jgi:hypothetical protein
MDAINMAETTPSPQSDDADQRSDSQQVQVQHLTALVPEGVSAGVFSTGAIVMTGSSEFVVDFVQNLGQPSQLAARVIVPHAVLPQFIEALSKNIQVYSERYGPIPAPPTPAATEPPPTQPTPQEIYDDLKVSDDVMIGRYANGMMIGHSQSEFRIDFLGNMFPRPIVTCRVFLSAPQVPRLRDSLTRTLEQFRQRQGDSTS